MVNKEILYDGYRTRYRRINMQYTIKELALIVGVSQLEIQIIETGKTNPNIDICRRIADALACSIESLFGYVDEEPISPHYYQPTEIKIIDKKPTKEKLVLDYIKENPTATVKEIANALNLTTVTVYFYLKKNKIIYKSPTKEKPIVDYLKENPTATVKEIANALNVTTVTVYRHLEKNKIIHKRPTKEKLVLDYIKENPKATAKEIVNALSVSNFVAYKYKRQFLKEKEGELKESGIDVNE